MKRVLLISILFCSIGMYAVTYPSNAYQPKHLAKGEMFAPLASQSTNVPTNVWPQSQSVINAYGNSLALSTDIEDVNSIGLSAPQQLSTTTYDNDYVLRREAPPSTGGENPENPNIYFPIGDGLIIMILLLGGYVVYRRRKKTICQ